MYLGHKSSKKKKTNLRDQYRHCLFILCVYVCEKLHVYSLCLTDVFVFIAPSRAGQAFLSFLYCPKKGNEFPPKYKVQVEE